MTHTPTILTVEDDLQVATLIQKSLAEQGYHTVQAFDGQQGLQQFEAVKPHLLITDVIMPVTNGLDLCRAIRQSGAATPILLLTALGTTPDIVAGLDAGADDYLAKPFQINELLARVRALLRRFNGNSADNSADVLQIGPLHIHLKSKEVVRDGQVIPLTAREFLLLHYLAKHKGQLVTRSQILEEVWNIQFDPGTNVVDVYISYLRNKIDKPFAQKLLQTRPGYGYILSSP